MANTVKITKKGQVTIPKYIRNILGSNVIEFTVEGGDIFIKPVNSVGGTLSSYARDSKNFKEIRDMAWEEAVRSRNK